MQHRYLTIKNTSLWRRFNQLYDGLRKSFESEKTPEDPTLKRYEIHERIMERGLAHPSTKKEVKELIAKGHLSPEGLN